MMMTSTDVSDRGVIRRVLLRGVACGMALVLLAVVWLWAETAKSGETVYVGSASVRPVPLDRLDHAVWNSLLKKYVDQDGMVAYAAWSLSVADRRALDGYLRRLSAARVSQSSDASAQMAFWINAYNAVTVHGILREYPTTSIRNHTSRLGGYNIWHDLQLYVEGRPVSLDAMEHQRLRPLGDPRIHFAIVCASKGCPRLRNEAYRGERLGAQLEDNARDFFSRPANFRHELQAGTFHLSAILNWFGDDFGGDASQRLQRIAAWLPDRASKAAATAGRVRIRFLRYDWGLNEQPRS